MCSQLRSTALRNVNAFSWVSVRLPGVGLREGGRVGADTRMGVSWSDGGPSVEGGETQLPCVRDELRSHSGPEQQCACPRLDWGTPGTASLTVVSSLGCWAPQCRIGLEGCMWGTEGNSDRGLDLWVCLVVQMVQNPPATWETWVGSLGWLRSPGEGNWLPTPVFLLGELHGQRSLAGYSPSDCKESDRTERLSSFTWLIMERRQVILTEQICFWSNSWANTVPGQMEHSKFGEYVSNVRFHFC